MKFEAKLTNSFGDSHSYFWGGGSKMVAMKSDTIFKT